jgi:DNA-binding transcriptional LysR family regulator
LFERTTRAINLTAEGQTLLDHARFLLAEVERTQEVVRASEQARPPVLRLGLLHAHTYTFFPALLRAFVTEHPDLDVQLVEYSTSGQLDTILSPSVDVGFVREPLSHFNIDVQPLFTEPYVLAIPSVLKPRLEVDVSIFQEQSIIGYPSHDDRRSTRSLFRDFLSQYNVRPRAWREVTTMHSALALVSANLGIAPVPQSQSTLRLQGVSYRSIKQTPPTLSVGIARRRDGDNPLGALFSDFAIEYFKS